MTKIIRFSQHAEQRMIERNANRREVVDAINHPTAFRKSGNGLDGIVWELERKFGKDTLRVIADVTKGTANRPTPEVEVLTVYWLGFNKGIRR
jgi:hypothetical protein